MTQNKITVGDYLLTRLNELGIEHMFGVPGDYNLGFLDQIVNHPIIEWVGTCNELNGAYASDGYARIKGAGALVTTFGVGELSAINGIAGAYAEYVPVVNIVGIPATSIQENKALVHHTLGDGSFAVFANMYKDITLAQTILSKVNAVKEIDRVLVECWLKKRPVYIGLPSDVCYVEVDAPKKALNLAYPPSNQDAVNEIAERVTSLVTKAKSPVILVDICAERHKMKDLILDFLTTTGIPFATMNMGKAIIDESHPQFIGGYSGDFSTPGVQKYVENSDCIITIGTIMSDFNTGGFTAKINANASVEIHSYYTRVKQSVYKDVVFCDTIPALTKRLSGYKYQGSITHPKIENYVPQDSAITHKRFWHQIAGILPNNAVVLAETGTSFFGTIDIPLPNGVTYIGQPLWASIGYTVGALLGACVAAPARPTILFIGDGSFQLSAQELSTIERHHFTPTIFLLNNDGYTIERVIHGATMPYNDISRWNYANFPKTLGFDVWSTQVETERELEQAFTEQRKNKGKLAFIEVKMGKMDAPEMLIKIAKAVAERNKYSVDKI